jgi:hypothetical protein
MLPPRPMYMYYIYGDAVIRSLFDILQIVRLHNRHIEERLERVAAFVWQLRTNDATRACHDTSTKGLVPWLGAWEIVPHGRF